MAEECTARQTSNGDTAAALPVPIADSPLVNLTANMLSGRQATVALPSQSSVTQLRRAFADAFALEAPGAGLHVIFGSLDLSEVETDALTLEEVGLANGSRLEVGLRSWVRPMAPPSKFHLGLKGRSRCRSSAFTCRYDLTVDVPGNSAAVETWRKNDHDKFNINTIAGTVTGYRGHWMCGNSEFHKELSFRDASLADVLKQWMDQCKPVFSETDRFWKSPESLTPNEKIESRPWPALDCPLHSEDDDLSKHRPRYHASDWFTAPSADCTELIVNARLPFMTLLRVLLNTEGRPIRAAVLVLCPNHDPVEEYDVRVEEM